MFMGRTTLAAVLSAFIISLFNIAWAEEGEVSYHKNMVIQVKKNLPLHRDDAVYRDFYLSAGINQGVQPGYIYPVYRRAAVHDPFFNRSQGDLLIHVADLMVFHVEPQVSVARIHSMTAPENRPVLEDAAVMVGDALDVSQGRRPAAASSGGGYPGDVGAATRPLGLSPEKALEALEEYRRAQSTTEKEDLPTGSLFEEDPAGHLDLPGVR